ncbi:MULTISPECIES: type IV secretion protein Rhs [Yersinia]|uniref:type IV secretion protein Rhs n=1 Tax=Yersinia TaxID=629 RepID=UPI000FFC6313|nr:MULTISPECIES: type IV secretion protein Rhs [Yersinia]RXA97661.1 type IV secretion protein Rhs [Yersinia sp. 2105 StPb PI]
MTKENKDTLKEGGIRLLTSGETELAKSVFGSTIQYHTVWIHHGSYLPFNLQDEHTAMTPNGEMYFRYWYRDDFSATVPHLRHLFIHEMSHVWQRAKGMNVIARGLVSWLVSYKYKLDGRLLSEYPMEQQAQIIADNFLLQTEGYKTWCDLLDSNNVTMAGDISEEMIQQKYTAALRGFPW